MKNKLILLTTLLLMGFVVAQAGTVSGTVIDATGEGLIGCNVVEKGTTNGTITDFDGNFTLTVSDNATLVFSFVGYKEQELPVKGNETGVKVTMSDDSELLDEVVVVGYGTMKKRDLSGAVAQIKSEDLVKGNPLDISQGLAGKVAGVQINASDGAPGGAVSIQVRGANSFTTNTQPLFIVDGIPFETQSTPTSSANSNVNTSSNPLTLINPHDIQSIEVLKDASATAIYGSRGANGVVLITTKRGEAGYENVEVSMNFSWNQIAHRVKVLDPTTYANYLNEQYVNSAKYEGKGYSELPYPGKWSYNTLPDGTLDYQHGTYNPGPNDFKKPGYYTDEYGSKTWVGGVDWQDEIYRTGFSQEYNISVSGGSEKGWHSFSGNFTKQDGIIKESGLQRFALRANLGRTINKWLAMGTNNSFTHSSTDFSKTNAYDYSLMRSALIFPVTVDPDHTDYTQLSNQYSWLASNPQAYIKDSKDNLKSISFFNASYIELTFRPYLKFKQNLGVSYGNNNRGTYYAGTTYEGSRTQGVNGRAGQADNWYLDITTESLLTFDKDLGHKGMHHLNAVVGFTIERTNYANKSNSATNFVTDATQEYNLGLGATPGPLVSGRGMNSLTSWLARANYSLLDRYIFTASYRADGSSKFTDENKWANFLSGAFAWRIGEEKLVKDWDVFSNLKARVSFGQTGNQAIDSYRTIPALDQAKYPFGGSFANGFAQASWKGPVSKDLKWETTSQWDFGLDVGFLKGKIDLTVDYYQKKTKDLLQEVAIPSSTGFETQLINSGNVTNEGVEITGNFVCFDKPNNGFKWTINANMSFNKNTIGGLDGDQFSKALTYDMPQVFIQRNGCPIGAIYGYVEDGFYDNMAEVLADPDPAQRAKGQKLIGEIKYRDLDGDGVITAKDRTVIGNTNPDFIYGLNTTFSWKGLSLGLFFQGSCGNDIFNLNLRDIKMGNINNITTKAYNSRWTDDPATWADAKWPKAVNSYERDIKVSDRFVENGSYFKLKNLTLAYDWKDPFKGVKLINISFNVNNVFTVTKYSWFDPEVNAFGTDASRRGVDVYSYPSSRTYAIGLRVAF